MVSFLRPLVDKALVVAGDQYDSIVNIKTELSSLMIIVSLIEGALPEAEEKQLDNPTIREWLRKFNDICYDARDILEEFVTVAAKSPSIQVISFRLQLPFRLVKKIKKLRKRLDSMVETAQLNFVARDDFSSHKQISLNAPKEKRSLSSPFFDRHLFVFVGREVEKEKIMEKLLNPKENHVEVVPIWGMGGVGKTALARSIYKDQRITEEQYPIKNRRWLYVGEKNFNAKEIISKITGESAGTNFVEVYYRKLIEKFEGGRFLIVLDDIWDINSNEWKLLWVPLINVGKGGLIIMTTRRREVITATNTLVLNDLRPLSNEDCWQIFESHAFTDRHSCRDLEQKKGIGKQIVEKLKGLPLAAEVVGRSLSSEPDVQAWKNCLEDDEWKLSTGHDFVMSVFRWSYNQLPLHLKQCFTYCSLFPKDHIFEKKMLVEMWMAHGFIQNVEGGCENKRPEDIGALYFMQLVNVSLFQCVDNKYVMHDMIHDLAILVSNEEFLGTNDLQLNVGQLEKVRHISIHHAYFWENSSLFKSRPTLKRFLTLCTVFDWNSSDILKRSISHVTPSLYKNVVQDIFKQLKSIRVLVLDSDNINYIPKCISDLIHLQYLNIEKTNVSRIPDTLCDLHNLQTLVAPTGYPVVTVLPKNIVNMSNLRHLRASLLTCKGVKNLTSLQELYSISVSKGDQISELGEIRQLRGKLAINCLENVTSWEDAAQAKMQEKTYIDRLELEFTKGLGDTDVQTNVLDALQCPPNVRVLVIRGYNGLTSPSWMVDGKLIMNLQTLRLSDCHRLESLPSLRQLYSLKNLRLIMMGALKKLGGEFYGKQINQKVFFPSLETLELGYMENLEWDDIVIEDTSVMFFPCLKHLYLFNCPKLVSALPHVKICTPHMDIKDPSKNAANVMRSLSELHIGNCDGLVVLELDILVSLKHLQIGYCSNLTRITSAVNVAATVETLCIEGCEKLEKMEFGSLSSLKTLRVSRCNELVSFPCLVAIEGLDVRLCKRLRSLSFSDRGWNSLQSLTVLQCPTLEILFEDAPTSSYSPSALRLSRLRVLRTDKRLVFSKMFEHDLVFLGEMCIGRFPKVKSFNKIVKNNWHKLTSLETLQIFRCEDLESLPPDIHKLSSLKKLWLYGCPKLQALPEDGLPLSLEQLVIAQCPLLYERCQRESGLDWHMIEKVPKREILQTITFRTHKMEGEHLLPQLNTHLSSCDKQINELAERFHLRSSYGIFGF